MQTTDILVVPELLRLQVCTHLEAEAAQTIDILVVPEQLRLHILIYIYIYIYKQTSQIHKHIQFILPNHSAASQIQFR